MKTMPVTIKDLRTRLGFRDPDEHALETRWEMANVNLKYGGVPQEEILTRRSGKTTEMVLQALVHVANTGEDVVLVGHSRSMAKHLERVAGDYAMRLGLDPRRIKGRSRDNPDFVGRGFVGRRDEQVFVDHVVTDGI